jgi:hypoxanthine-guanine phosphoribosyltransferase
MVEKMEKLLEYLRQAGGRTLDVDDAFVRLTTDTLGVVGFGKDFGALEFRDLPIIKVWWS